MHTDRYNILKVGGGLYECTNCTIALRLEYNLRSKYHYTTEAAHYLVVNKENDKY